MSLWMMLQALPHVVVGPVVLLRVGIVLITTFTRLPQIILRVGDAVAATTTTAAIGTVIGVM